MRGGEVRDIWETTAIARCQREWLETRRARMRTTRDARVGARERMWEISRDRIARGGGGYGGWMATRAGERERERDAGPIRRDATTETTETTDDSPAVCFDDAEKSFSRSRVC